MAQPLPARARLPRPLLLLGLLLLALLAMAGILRNEWVQDDVGVIFQNALVHHLDGTWKAFGQPYWPNQDFRELYRPLMIALFSAQWAIGDGAPVIFRVFNLLAYAAAIFSVFGLVRRLAPAPAAWLGAALFAVHPIHVEAVALAVNQGETLVAALLCWCAARYIDWRRGEIPTRAAFGPILLAFALGLFIKEHALILPGLLFALELSVLADGTPWRERARKVLPLHGSLFVAGALFWTIRTAVLGVGSGTAPMETLKGLTPLGRAATMLGVVPEWIRLLVWPAHLQMEWSPLEYVAYSGWTLRETIGGVGLLSLLLALGLAWGRRPRIALGLLWIAVALFPVSNLAMATGVIIAERVLFLASVGVAIIAADLAAALIDSPAMLRRPVRLTAMLGIALLLGTGMVASATRTVVWRDRELFVVAGVQEAPLSYRTQLAYGVLLHEKGLTALGDTVLGHAVALHNNDMGPFQKIAWSLQHKDSSCSAATTLYAEMLKRLPKRGDIRSGYIACATWLGRYADAAAGARAGIAARVDAEFWGSVLNVVDSAAAVSAAPYTVRLPKLPGGWTAIGDLDTIP